MGVSVITDKTCTVDRENNMAVHEADVGYHLVISSLKER